MGKTRDPICSGSSYSMVCRGKLEAIIKFLKCSPFTIYPTGTLVTSINSEAPKPKCGCQCSAQPHSKAVKKYLHFWPLCRCPTFIPCYFVSLAADIYALCLGPMEFYCWWSHRWVSLNPLLAEQSPGRPETPGFILIISQTGPGWSSHALRCVRYVDTRSPCDDNWVNTWQAEAHETFHDDKMPL